MLLDLNYNQHYISKTLRSSEYIPKRNPNLYYSIKAAGNIPEYFTGKVHGRVQFENGLGKAYTQYDLKLMELRGCKDVTPPEMYERLKQRDLKKILVIRNAAWGDGLIITPAFKALRQKYPNAQIDVFGREDSRVIYENIGCIDNILLFRTTELGNIIDEYDEVFDLIHSIECNAKADFMNALDVAKEILQLDKVENTRPIYNATQYEFSKCREICNQIGIIPGKDKVILFQAEASAKVRTLPYTTTMLAAYELANRLDHKIVFVGHDPQMPNVRLMKDRNSTNMIADVVKQATGSIEKDGTTWDILPLPHNIRFAHVVNGKYKAREIFALGYLADVILTVDSFWSHLAAALNKPSVLIFSNYHPYTRTKYYDNCSVIAPDYKKITCAPCNGLFDTCHMSPNGPARCISSISYQDIVSATMTRLLHKNLLYQEKRDSNPVSLDNPRRLCPGCGSKSHSLACSKGEYIFLQCESCNSIYTDKYPNQEFWRTLRKKVKEDKFYKPNRNEGVKNLLLAIGHGLRKINKPIPSGKVLDISSISDKFCGRNSFKEVSRGVVETVSKLNKKVENDLILWIDEFCEQEDPTQSILDKLDKMKADSYLAVVSPIANAYDKNSNWSPLNPPVAGTNNFIPHHKYFTLMFDKDSGKYKDIGKILFCSINDKSSITLIQKV